MKTLARFVIRPNDENRGDLILGAMMKYQDHNLLAPNIVYEISECLGELVIRPLGSSPIGKTIKDTKLEDFCWAQSVDQILDRSDGMFVITQQELDNKNKNG